jgi:hypothetical protein
MKLSCFGPLLAMLTICLSCFNSVVNADIDWGGGLTRFYDESGEALTSQSGCATLVAVSAGELIDFRSFIPEHPSDLIQVGSELTEGDNINRVIAQSCFFYSGYLLYSAIPDLTVEELTELGVTGGESLYLVVWDCSSFVDDAPTDRSYYTVQALFLEGEGDSPVSVMVDSSTVFAQLVHPTNALGEDQTLFAAERAGHNTYSGFLEWAQSELVLDYEIDDFSARSLDADSDGRSNFEEYAFSSPPTLQAQSVASDALSVSAELSAKATDLIEGSSAPQFYVELRANDSTLSYMAHASSDLSEWSSSELYFEDGQWYSSSTDVAIVAESYVGEGVWTLAMQYQGPNLDTTCFYKMSVDEVVP